MGQYGRIGKRRSGSATWQWMLLGFFPGILCGGVLIFTMFASGALNSLTTASMVSPTAIIIREIQVVTATPGPTTEVPATSIPTEAPEVTVGTAAEFELPTSTPLDMLLTREPNAAVPVGGGTATPVLANSQSVEMTTVAGTNPQPTIDGVAAAPTSGVPAALQSALTTMVTIPGSTFTMGTDAQEVLIAVDECLERDGGNCEESHGADSNPQFQVQLDSYQMEVTEVTFEQYVAFLNYQFTQGKNHRDSCPSPNGASNLCIQTSNENPTDAVVTFDSTSYGVFPGLLKHPVYGVTWAGAVAYCQAIGRRLPTEAEWEYAAKGDSGRIYPWGDIWNPANAKTRIPRDLPAGTVAVGSYPGGTTPSGLYDMAGNVQEWVQDWYNETYYSELANQPQPVINPRGPNQGIEKVLRGGSWDTLPFYTRTVHRLSEFPAPDGNNSSFPRDIGFRCAADVSATAPVANGAVDPANLGLNVPPAVSPTSASAGAEGTAQPGSGQQG